MSKEKSPAFQFYPSDYLADINVQLMTMEEEGCYFRLMLYCWREGSLPDDISALTALCKGTKVSDRVVQAFVKQESTNGCRLVHPRLEREREKQALWREKSAKGGRRSAHKRKHPRKISPEHGGGTLQSSSSSSSLSSISNNKSPLIPLVLEQWANTPGVKGIRKLSDSRRKLLLTRLRDPDWDWQGALKKFPLQCFQGNGNWQPNIDWFLRPGTVDGILEGKYDFTPGKTETPQERRAREEKEYWDTRIREAEQEEGNE